MNTKTFLLFGGLGIIAATTLFSFSNKKEDDTFRKIEIIRTVDGQSTSYDTLVSSDSDFGANDYLKELGFDKDENICIVNLSSDIENFDCSGLFSMDLQCTNGDGVSNVSIDVDLDGIENLLKESVCKIETCVKDLEKNVKCSASNANEGNLKDCDWSKCLDSMFTKCTFTQKCDTSFANGLCRIVCFSDMKCDSAMMTNCHSFKGGDGKCQIEVDMDISDCKSAPKCGFMKSGFCKVSGNESNCTVVIVTEDVSPNKSQSSHSLALENGMKVFPNPATENVSIQLDLKEKDLTRIHITDMKGNVIKSMDFGNFNGKTTERVDVSDWARGTYLVRLTHGEYSRVEKLLVE